MKKLLFLISICIVFVNSNAYSKCSDQPIRIGVIDTGFGYHGLGKEARLCKTDHKNFSSEIGYTLPGQTSVPVPLDLNSHGTNVVGIIESYLKPAHVNYCIVILKYHGELPYWQENLQNTIEAFKYATKNGIKYLNYSSGGDRASETERKAVEDFLDNGGILVASAGNDGRDLDSPHYGYYPAKYDKRIIVVGSLDFVGVKLNSSNYGSVVNRWERGLFVTGYGITMSGTSQAAATAMGKIVSQSNNKCGGN